MSALRPRIQLFFTTCNIRLTRLSSSCRPTFPAEYANRHGAGGGGRGRRYVSATGSDDTSGGRGQAGSGRLGQRGSRGGRGRGNPRRTYANNVDITDPHCNFTSAEWEKHGTICNYVLQLREGGGRGGGRGNSDNRPTTNSTANGTTSGVMLFTIYRDRLSTDVTVRNTTVQ